MWLVTRLGASRGLYLLLAQAGQPRSPSTAEATKPVTAFAWVALKVHRRGLEGPQQFLDHCAVQAPLTQVISFPHKQQIMAQLPLIADLHT